MQDEILLLYYMYSDIVSMFHLNEEFPENKYDKIIQCNHNNSIYGQRKTSACNEYLSEIVMNNNVINIT